MHGAQTNRPSLGLRILLGGVVGFVLALPSIFYLWLFFPIAWLAGAILGCLLGAVAIPYQGLRFAGVYLVVWCVSLLVAALVAGLGGPDAVVRFAIAAAAATTVALLAASLFELRRPDSRGAGRAMLWVLFGVGILHACICGLLFSIS